MTIFNIMNYRLHRYFKSSKPVFPLMLIFCFIGSMYTFKPMDVLSGYIISGVFVFGLMIFVVFNMGGGEEKAEEQIVFLRVDNPIEYYISRELSFIIICALYSLITSLTPVLVNILNGFAFFTRNLTAEDVVMGFILLFGSGISGIIIGDGFNIRIMKNRKLSLLLTTMVALLAFSNDGIQQKVSYLRGLNFLLPSIMAPAKAFSSDDVIHIGKMLMIFFEFVTYYIIFGGLKIMVMNKNRFE